MSRSRRFESKGGVLRIVGTVLASGAPAALCTIGRENFVIREHEIPVLVEALNTAIAQARAMGARSEVPS